MAEKALTAVLSAQESISESLASVADALEEVAESAGVTGEAMDKTEESADEVRNAMAETSAVLQEAQEGFQGVGVEARQAAMAEEDFAQAGENVRNAQMAMSQANERAESTLAEESQTFREAILGAEGLADAKDAASRANQVLSGTAKATQDALGDEIGAMYRMAQSANTTDEFIDNLINSELTLAAVAEKSESELRSMSTAMAANAVAARIDEEALNDLRDSLEETGDEATQTALQMAGLSGAFAATSLNLGPFNFALRQAAVQLPQLVAVTGSLAASLGGLATAAGTAGAAIAAIYGGGVLAMAERMAMVNSEYENTWEAIQGVMEDVRGTFMRALQPLMNQQAVEMFKDGITGLASALNLFAQLVNRLQGDIDEFLGSLSTSFFENANAILMELEKTVEAFLPILADFFEWFSNKLPGALQFFRTEGKEFTKALADFGNQFMDFFRAFSEIGIAAFEGVLPAIGGVLAALRMVVDVLNMLPNEVIAAATAFLVLSRSMSGALGMGISFGRFLSGLVTSITQARSGLGLLNSVLASFHLTSAQEALGLLANRLNMLDDLFLQSSDAAQTAMRDIESLNIGDDIGENVQNLPDRIGSKISTLNTRIESGMSSAATTIRTRLTSAWDDATSYIMSTAGSLRSTLPAAFSSALGAVGEKFRQFNVDSSFTDDLASDVALGGPRISQDVPEMQVHTKTGRAQQALSNLQDSLVQTGGKMRSFATSAVGTVRNGLESLAARGFGAVSVFTGLGEAALSAVPGLGSFDRAVGNIRSGITTMAPELVTAKNSILGMLPSMDEFNRSALSFADSVNARVRPAADALGSRMQVLAGAINNPRGAINSLADSLRSRGGNALEAFNTMALSAADTLNQRVRPAVDAFGQRMQVLAGAINNPRQALSNMASRVMTGFNNRANSLAATLNAKLLPAVNSFGDSANAVADDVTETVGPMADEVGESANAAADRLNNISIQGFRNKLSSMKTAAANATIGQALDVSFDDSGMRDMQTGAYTNFSKVIKSRVSGAVNTALGPIRKLGGRIRSVASGFAQSVASIDSYSEAVSAVNRRTTAAINRLRALAVTASRRVVGGLRKAAGALYNYAAAMVPATVSTQSFNLSLTSLAMAPVKAVRGLAGLITTIWGYVTGASVATISTYGFVQSLARVSYAGTGAIASLAGFIATTLSLAATETIATAATYALGTALNVALAGIPALIGLIVVAAGALVGILGNLGGITSSAQSAFEGLKQAGKALFNALLTIGAPVWNLFITLLEVILAPLFAVWDAFVKLAQGLGLISEGAGGAGGMLASIGDLLGWLTEITADFFSVFIGPLNMLADLIYAAIYIPLSLIVDVIVGIIDIIGEAINWFMNLQMVQQIINGIHSGVQMLEDAWASLMAGIGSVVDYVKSQVEVMVNFIIGMINGFISTLNNLPMVNISKLGEFEFGGGGGPGGASERLAGAEASAGEARKNAEEAMADDSKDGQDEMAGGQKTVINTYEQNNYNFGDFEMKPEEKARVKGLVQEAIEEANRTKRLRDGGI